MSRCDAMARRRAGPGLEASKGSSSNRIARIVYMDTYGAFNTDPSVDHSRDESRRYSPFSSSEALSEEKVGETVRSDRGLDRIEAPSIGHTPKPFSSMTVVQTSDLWVGLKSFVFDKVSSIARPASSSPRVWSQDLTLHTMSSRCATTSRLLPMAEP